MFDTFKNRLELKGTLTTVTALKIGAGRSVEPTDPDVPVIKDALGHPLIPGSSLKGALRSRLESFLRGVNLQFANDPSELSDSLWMNQVKTIKETAAAIKNDRARDIHITDELKKITDKASFLFGCPWLAGKLQIRDLTVQPGNWFGQYQERDGVAINRDTETAADKRKYDFQVVPAGTIFDFHAIVENAEDWELGLLMIGLHQLETEQIPLGGGRSRGLGVVKLKINDVWWFDYPEEQPEQLLTYLQHIVGDNKNHYKLETETFGHHKQDWTTALVNHLTNAATTTAPAV
jgi:CRISPR-associated RAMP protein (TIGR02581 family)